MEVVNGIVEHRQDTESNYISNNTVLYAGEIALATDTGILKVGDGTKEWDELDPINNIYKSFRNGHQFNPSRMGEPVRLQHNPTSNQDEAVVQSSGDIQSFTAPTTAIAGVWAEDGVLPGAEGKVLLRGVGQVEVRQAVEAGDRIMQGQPFIPAGKAYNAIMIGDYDATADNTLYINQPIVSADCATVEILTGDTPAEIVAKIGAVSFAGFDTLTYPNTPSPLMVIFFAQDAGQKFILTGVDCFFTDTGDNWFDNAMVMGSIGAEEGGARNETGRIRFSSSTCPSNGTISITLPGETTPITRVCTAGDSRTSVYTDLIANAPSTYTLFRASSTASSLFYRANTAESKSGQLTFDGGDTGWTNTGGTYWQVLGSDAQDNGASVVSSDSDAYCFGTVLETIDQSGYTTVLVDGSNTIEASTSSPQSIESAGTIDISNRSASVPVEISGTAEITTINKMGHGMQVVLPTGEWTLATGGNIAAASTAVVGKVMTLVYGSDNLWHPSY